MMRCVPRLVIPGLVLIFLLRGTWSASAAPPTHYYLALGDSLSLGAQPDATGTIAPTNQGYADDLLAMYRADVPTLQLVKLGCIRETTTTMLRGGGLCTYPLGSQLAQAVDFLQHHRVSLVTIDIGANNIDDCVSLVPVISIDIACIQRASAAAAADLPAIVAALRAAAGPSVPIVAMNYYDPALAAWLFGLTDLAEQSVDLTVGFNDVLEAGYATLGIPAFRIPVVDVESLFRTTEFTPLVPLPGPLPSLVPINVALICQWTWICAPPPRGPNVHATPEGYAAIAAAFARTIGHLHP